MICELGQFAGRADSESSSDGFLRNMGDQANILTEALGAAQGGVLALIFTMPIETVQKTQVAKRARRDSKNTIGDICESCKGIAH